MCHEMCDKPTSKSHLWGPFPGVRPGTNGFFSQGTGKNHEHTSRMCYSNSGLFLEVWGNFRIKHNNVYGGIQGLTTFKNCYHL